MDTKSHYSITPSRTTNVTEILMTEITFWVITEYPKGTFWSTKLEGREEI